METLPINVWLFGVNLPKSSTPTVVPFFPKDYCLLIKKNEMETNQGSPFVNNLFVKHFLKCIFF